MNTTGLARTAYRLWRSDSDRDTYLAVLLLGGLILVTGSQAYLQRRE